jgi:fluoroquinolone resistance protein
MSLKKPIAEIRTGLFCFWPPSFFSSKIPVMNNYFENNIFNEADFPKSFDGNVEFIECQFHGIDFTIYNFSRFKFIDCEFKKCDFNNISVRGSTFRGPKFVDSKLMGVNWTQASTFLGPAFKDCLLDYSLFQSMNLKSVIFKDCKMSEVDFYEAQCMKASFCGSSLYGSTFNGANLSEADFRGATEYSINVKETTVGKAKFSMPEAVSLLSALNIVID